MRGILRRESVLSAVLLAVFTTAASGAIILVWSGGHSTDNWTAVCNWSDIEPCANNFPNASNEHAWFPVKSGGGTWGNIELNFATGTPGLTIGDMTALDGIELSGSGHHIRHLTTGTFTIDATDDAVTVEIGHAIDFTAN